MSNYTYLNSSNFDAGGRNHSFSFYVITFSASIVVTISSPVAVVGNALVLAAIRRNPSLRTPSYILLAGLAFTDFCTGIITQPFYVANEFMYLVEPQMNTTRTTLIIIQAIVNCSATFFSNMTALIITLMSIERWLHMTRTSMITVRRACYIVVFLLFLLIPIMVYRAVHSIKGTHRLEADIYSISVLLFCLTVTSVAYFKVFQIIRHHQQQIHLSQDFAQPAVNFEKYKKSVFSILYILVIFYIGFLPIVITLCLRLVSKTDLELEELFLNVSMVFVFLSSSLNPLLYFWRMKDIRNEVTRLVKRILRKD